MCSAQHLWLTTVINSASVFLEWITINKLMSNDVYSNMTFYKSQSNSNDF